MLANDTHFMPEDVSGSGGGWEPGEWHRPLQGHLYSDGPAPGVPGRLDLQTEPGRFLEETTIAWDLERKRMQAGGGGLFLEREGAMGTWRRGLDPWGRVKLTAGCCPCSVALGAERYRLPAVEGPPPGLQPLGLLWDSRPWGRIGRPAPRRRCSGAGILHATPQSPSSHRCPSAGRTRPSSCCSSGSDPIAHVFTAVHAGFSLCSPSVALTPVCYRKGSSGSLRGGCAWDPGQQMRSWMGPWDLEARPSLSHPQVPGVLLELVPPIDWQRGAGLSQAAEEPSRHANSPGCLFC